MKVFVVIDDEYGIDGLFSSAEIARESFPDGTIEERLVHSVALPVWSYWHLGANVYPDGSYDQWEQEHSARGEVSMPDCDDHLNAMDAPWDGHTQSHCGEHISIFGTDRNLVELAFKKHLAKAISRQTGICQTRFGKHGDGIDGRNTYAAGFMKPPRTRR